MNFLKIFLSAIVGGLIVLLGTIFFQSNNPKDLSVAYRDSGNTTQAMYTVNEEGDVVPVDFTVTAELVNASVVNITSFGNPEMAGGNQRLPDPFRDFFGDQWDQFFQKAGATQE